jgi:uncharacterized protein (DUF488 family)
MWTEKSGIAGVGYEGHDLASFLEYLKPWDVDVLVDVRLNAISRKKGFSKTGLSLALAAAGIRYLHFPALGNPKDNRDGFWAPGTSKAVQAHERYRELLGTEIARAAIDSVACLAVNERVVLLCFEASELCCHRRLILEAVETRLATLTHS